MVETPQYDAWRRRYDSALVDAVDAWLRVSEPGAHDAMVVCYDLGHAAWMAETVARRVTGHSAQGAGRTVRRGSRRVSMVVDPRMVDTFRVSVWWCSPGAKIGPEIIAELHRRGATAPIVEVA